MKKIGILTFYSAHNYGGSLQAFALKTYLISRNNDVSFIQFVPQKLRDAYSYNPFKNSNSLRAIVRKILIYPQRKKQYMKFERFIKENLDCHAKIFSLRQLDDLDILITGSDQVWNDDITGNNNEYFLTFDTPAKKISYAASFGRTNISSQIVENIQMYLPEFSAISVREASGIETITKHINSEVEQVCDPVFLLPKEYWVGLVENINLLKGKFILYYSLQNNEELYTKTVELSIKLNLPIYGIHPLSQRQGKKISLLNNIGPLEFIWLINNAEVVCSNSFHAVAFSVILNKNIYHVPHKTLGVRSLELLERLGVTKEDLSEVIITERLKRDKLNDLIQQSKLFLEKNIR